MIYIIFLSDLCGREEARADGARNGGFLSDLCGREVDVFNFHFANFFLSDLCGREEIKT